MKKIIAIAGGLFAPKKEYAGITKKNLYLNYGLLSICSVLKRAGYDVRQFQGEYSSPEDLIDTIEKSEYRIEDVDFPILVSMISFLSLEWCNKLTYILSCEYGKRVFLGGKYVVDGNIEWLKRKLPYVDEFITGDGEETILDVLGIESKRRYQSCNKRGLDYSALYEYYKYNPSIELARGCGRGCNFCADANRKVSQIKRPCDVVEEISVLEQLYNHEPFTIYYQMPSMIMTKWWVNDYLQGAKRLDYIHQWRCTSRIDDFDISRMEKLVEAGLKVVDFGLESASPKQLIKMGKTIDAAAYLDKAERILEEARKFGVWVKFNILLVPGETLATVNETINWLDERKELIKGVSVNSEMIFGPENHSMDIYEKSGASYVGLNDLVENGYAYINLSNEISYDKSKQIAITISKMIMTARDYYDLKKFGYFPRTYNYDDFCMDIQKCDIRKLPFMV